jgi:D-alanine-D-alanine ligase
VNARLPSRTPDHGRVRVAVVFGGRSNEHAISCVSAGSILRNLDPERFEVVAVGITPDGSWVLTDGDPDTLAIADRRLPTVSSESGSELALTADPGRAGQLVSLSPGGAEVLAAVDVVFPVLHGPYGEDGTIQGLLELAGVPYVGAGVLASAAGMDKEFTKKLLVAEGLPIGDYAVLRPSEPAPDPEQLERLGLPAFVKPARGGSSIGVSRVTSWQELPAAIAHARQHDPKVIVESAIVGRELECGVLEFPDGTVQASTVGEIRVAGIRGREDSFYDFATKYLDDAAELDVPAKIDDDVSDAVGELAIRAFKAIDGRGLARVDFFLTEDGPLINEVNTMPGFTTISMYPRMWAASGVDYQTLLATMVDAALARGTGLR